ncbi:class I SAM-dependent methyltransferase [Mycetocola reblochoni]|uniref:23S rRNA (Guanine-N-2-)-methyltransferase rlmG n=2 Tax=Mycetocola reblochoni TaxID=331618 RepID=A0A1R4K8L7_9MICO|nr:methyltransferase [Mycetocola reblochoni]RLP67823.1 methyltransferase domain-containing protein [Mycetocola reblochoni]SJN40462.1 23S rRNA (guanine-N-2-)-methyltransferase rlmG [Mycetocola reblochoni REB411]
MAVPPFDVTALRRHPDVEAPNLQAWDATDRYLLDLAAERVAADPSLRAPGAVTVIGDRHGALSLGARLQLGAATVRSHQDGLLGERAIAANAARLGVDGIEQLPLGRALVDGARLVLLQLPRANAALDEQAALIAAGAASDVVVLAGGRVKHMSRTQTGVLSEHFRIVDATLARQKSRVLLASGPVPGVGRSYPERRVDAELGIEIIAHGAAFNGTGLDLGTRELLGQLHLLQRTEGRAVDLGCGTGVLAVELARRFPSLSVLATDQSLAAVDSATATVSAAGLRDRVRVVRDDGLSAQADDSAELVLLNPPFHIGAAVHTGLAERLFADASRVLVPGGELWTVWNSHLGYRGALERLVGPTEQLHRTPKFTVTRSLAR